MLAFVRWYNTEHRHSALHFVMPAQRHNRDDAPLLAQRHTLYEQANAARPERWSGTTRDSRRRGAVSLNPAGAARATVGARGMSPQRTFATAAPPGHPWEGRNEGASSPSAMLRFSLERMVGEYSALDVEVENRRRC